MVARTQVHQDLGPLGELVGALGGERDTAGQSRRATSAPNRESAPVSTMRRSGFSGSPMRLTVAERRAGRTVPILGSMSDDEVDPFGEDGESSRTSSPPPHVRNIAKMFQNQGPLNWDVARQTAYATATGGIVGTQR
ncbi:MAG: hypothetical protein R2705_10270 [Ilumatobacteraceae bacterium]